MLENKARIGRKEINLIPLVNVIFLLLTFFIVAGSIEKVSPFVLNLPDSSRNGEGKPQRANIIYMQKDGAIAINDDFVARKDFRTIVNTLLIDNKGNDLIIKSDSDVSSKDLIWVLHEIESVGGINVSIVTQVVK